MPERDPSGRPGVAVNGRRKAGKDRRPLLAAFVRVLPPPVMLGLAAITVSAGGAVTLTESASGFAAPADDFAYSVQASALSGGGDSDQIAAEVREREEVVSRDSERDAEEKAANQQLQQAVEQQAQERNAALSQLAARAEAHAKQIEANKWVLPVTGYHITNTFGQAESYYSSGYHTGLDFAVAEGTPIHAVASGTITSMGYEGSYGNRTIMTLDDGTELWYCHQVSFGDIAVGDTVAAGDVIGYVGTTGNSTGPHLHLEVHPGGGDPVDPAAALAVHGLTV